MPAATRKQDFPAGGPERAGGGAGVTQGRFAQPHSSGTLQEPEIERPEYQDDPDVRCQPLPHVLTPEEQDVHTDHDDYQREHVQHDHDGCLPSHGPVLLCALAWSKTNVAAWDRP